jgi:hypothetical protein
MQAVTCLTWACCSPGYATVCVSQPSYELAILGAWLLCSFDWRHRHSEFIIAGCRVGQQSQQLIVAGDGYVSFMEIIGSTIRNTNFFRLHSKRVRGACGGKYLWPGLQRTGYLQQRPTGLTSRLCWVADCRGSRAGILHNTCLGVGIRHTCVGFLCVRECAARRNLESIILRDGSFDEFTLRPLATLRSQANTQ